MGCFPLLQRSARNVIYIATSYRALSTTYDFETVTQEDFDPDAALVVDQLFSLFGYGSSASQQVPSPIVTPGNSFPQP